MSLKRAAQSSPEPPAPQAPRTDSFDCLIDRPESCDCRCPYHRFLIECDPETLIVPFPMPESKRQFTLSSGKQQRRSAKSALRRIDVLPFERKKTSRSLAVARLSRFLELLDMFCAAPWLVSRPLPPMSTPLRSSLGVQRTTSPTTSCFNGSRTRICRLSLGASTCASPEVSHTANDSPHCRAGGQETLKGLITSDSTLTPGNQVWICNRQQGTGAAIRTASC